MQVNKGTAVSIVRQASLKLEGMSGTRLEDYAATLARNGNLLARMKVEMHCIIQ